MIFKNLMETLSLLAVMILLTSFFSMFSSVCFIQIFLKNLSLAF